MATKREGEMASEVTEAKIRANLDRFKYLSDHGHVAREVDATWLLSLCESWLQMRDALRWVPVSERLPAPCSAEVGCSDLVLATRLNKGGSIEDIQYGRYFHSTKRWNFRGLPAWWDPTHWREIGPLPKEGE